MFSDSNSCACVNPISTKVVGFLCGGSSKIAKAGLPGFFNTCNL